MLLDHVCCCITDGGDGGDGGQVCLVSVDHLPRHVAPDGRLDAVLGRLTGIKRKICSVLLSCDKRFLLPMAYMGQKMGYEEQE